MVVSSETNESGPSMGDGRLIGEGLPSDQSQLIANCTSFHTHIQDIISQSRKEGDFGQPIRGIGAIVTDRESLDLTNYKPVQAFPLNHPPISITTLNHDLAKNIVAIHFETRLSIFKLQKNKCDDEEFFTLTKIQEFRVCHSDQSVGFSIVSFSINAASNVSEFGDRRLVYAFCIEDDSKIYFVSEVKNGREAFTRIKTFESQDVRTLDSQSGAVRQLSFDADRGELLASLFDSPLCVVWDVRTMEETARITLKSPGITCLWHKSEPAKLLIVEIGGVIRLYNTNKQSTIFTINTLLQPIFSADWSPTSQLVGIGANKSAYIFDLSLLNSEADGKRLEGHVGPTHAIKFSTTDKQQLATATIGPRPEIRAYQHNFKTSVWTSKQESLQSIAWIYGQPFLLALAGKQLLIYESLLA